MAGVYVDTSALGRVLLDEPGASSVLRELGGYSERVASRLLAVELSRLGLRTGLTDQAADLAAGVALIPIDEAVLKAAMAVSPSTAATLDAIHLVTALSLAEEQRVEALLTYDARLAEGARHHGLAVLAP